MQSLREAGLGFELSSIRFGSVVFPMPSPEAQTLLVFMYSSKTMTHGTLCSYGRVIVETAKKKVM